MRDHLGVVFTPGPDDSESEIRKGLWVMLTAVRFSYPGLYVYTQEFLKLENRKEILAGIKHLENETQRCEEWVVKRFPDIGQST